MKNIYKILILLISIIAVSCDEFLEEEPPTFVSSANFFKTASDARTACDAVYQMLNDGSWNSLYGRWWPAIDLATDDVTSKVNRNNFSAWFSHTINASHPWMESWGQYSNFWVGISRANAVINKVPGIDMDETERDAIVGEARALRALYYYYLVRTYGDVPYLMNAVETKSDFQLPRTDVDVIYNDIIIPDLIFAEDHCVDGLHDGHISKWTAKVILAEVYLTRAGWRRTSQGEFVQGADTNWELARDKAKEILDNSPHALITEAAVNGQSITPACGVAWNESFPFTKESMLELSHQNEYGYGSLLARESGPWAHGANFWGAGTDTPLSEEGINMTVAQMRFPGKPPAVGMYIPTPDLWRAYEEGDERRDWGLMTRYTTPEGNNYLCQPTFRKYLDIDYYLGKENTTYQNTNNNFVVYRYADALLIYAEAANEVAEVTAGDAAFQAVNEIRIRAGLGELSDTIDTQDEFRKAVWKERRCEFAGECKRRFDLIRTNRLATETLNIGVTWTTDDGALKNYSNKHAQYTGNVAWPDREWLMPIPSTDLKLNEENGWKQNAGY